MIDRIWLVLLLSGCAVSHPPRRNFEALVRKYQAAPDTSPFSDYRIFREQDLLTVRVEEKKLPAVVKKVFPNGNLFIEGQDISGVVRPMDIAQDNSVRSAYLADAELAF